MFHLKEKPSPSGGGVVTPGQAVDFLGQ